MWRELQLAASALVPALEHTLRHWAHSRAHGIDTCGNHFLTWKFISLFESTPGRYALEQSSFDTRVYL